MSDWNSRVMAEFRANGGKVVQFGDVPLVIAHTVGAKSGRVHEVPLVALADGERLVIFASKAGAPTHPDWYHNLKANPRIAIEYGSDRFEVEVRELAGDERDRCLTDQIGVMPQFGEYVTKAAPRVIPVLALERV